MLAKILPASALAAVVIGVSTGSHAYVATLPAPIPAALERPMSPFAACAAEAQEQFLSGPAYDSFVQRCSQSAVADICSDAASRKKLTGRKRTAFTRKCAEEMALGER